MTESYGICLYRKNKKNELELLMIRRRCSYSFYFIANGIFQITNLRTLLEGTTYAEKIVLSERNFEYVYFTAFGFNPAKLGEELYARYKKAEKRFLKIFTPQYISRELIGLPSINLIWEFPKGKLKFTSAENSLECAAREFQEETGIREYELKDTAVTFDFKDSGKLFRYTLYIAEAHNLEINQFRKHSYTECCEMTWVNIHCGRLMLNDHMLKLYKKLHNTIKKMHKKNYAEFICYNPK